MRPPIVLVAALVLSGILLATSLFTLWVLSLIWKYGMIWVGEPNKLVLALEIVMAQGSSCFAAWVLVKILREGVKKIWS